ncbi:MAG TPA: aspartate kinase [Candidatus Thermoplasmatota archaeon]|nr:aspartate kinase [Candidatus Thermoplasmatota archaeon]
MKFGGTSVGSGPMLQRACEIVERAPRERVVVISAMSGVTDSIIEALPRIQRDEGAIEPFLRSLLERHLSTLREAGVSDAELTRVTREIDTLLQRFERLLYGIAYTEELTAKTKDMAVSFGERLSVRVLAGLLRSRRVEAEAVDADEAGMLTDGVFGNASPVMPAIAKNLERSIVGRIQGGVTPVMTGFFGCDNVGRVTTFGRGGSDYAASIVAAALRAERLEIWKDVDGFLTADPRIIKDAQPIDAMTYDEAAELAYTGAKVLHPRTVEPLKEVDIPIVVRNTGSPELQGTVITNNAPVSRRNLRSAAVKENLAIVRISGPGMGYTPGVGEKVFTALGRSKVNVYNMAASQASFALLIDQVDLDRAMKSIQGLNDPIIQSVEGITDQCLVCVVGVGIGSTHGTAGKIFTAVGRAGVNVEMISVGASDIALNFVVTRKDRNACIQAIHSEFLVEKSP